MDSYSIRYRFSQPFEVLAKTAYEWCTDYQPDDWKRMGKRGTRKIQLLNEDTLILTDTVAEVNGPVTKKRLVRLNPDQMSWTNTHLAGPNKHSQFLYKIIAVGNKSRLDFTGLQVSYGQQPSASRIRKMARELRNSDSGMWVLLAKEMSKDLFQKGR